MTNEEKAREIAKKNAIIYDAEEDTANGLIYPTIHSTEECEKSAIEMAELKDQQFKEVIVQIRNWLYTHGKLDKLDLVEFDMKVNKLLEAENESTSL